MEETLTEHGRGCVTYILDNNIMVKTTLSVLRISRYSLTYRWVMCECRYRYLVPTTYLHLVPIHSLTKCQYQSDGSEDATVPYVLERSFEGDL